MITRPPNTVFCLSPEVCKKRRGGRRREITTDQKSIIFREKKSVWGKREGGGRCYFLLGAEVDDLLCLFPRLKKSFSAITSFLPYLSSSVLTGAVVTRSCLVGRKRLPLLLVFCLRRGRNRGHKKICTSQRRLDLISCWTATAEFASLFSDFLHFKWFFSRVTRFVVVFSQARCC